MRASSEPSGTAHHSSGEQLSEVEMMALTNRFYAAEAEYVAAGAGADFADVAACLHPDVTLYQAPGLPFTGSGSWHGHLGIQAFLDLFAATWQSMDLIEVRALADGDTMVMLIHVRLRARATGRTIETRIVQVNVVRDGRIIEFRPYYWNPSSISEVCSGPVDSTIDSN